MFLILYFIGIWFTVGVLVHEVDNSKAKLTDYLLPIAIVSAMWPLVVVIYLGICFAQLVDKLVGKLK